jgi:hypothetical protein
MPGEIHNAIVFFLDHPKFFPDLHNLRITNHYFHNLIPAPSHATRLAAEVWNFARDRTPPLVTCCQCVRLRPATRFAKAMQNGARGWGGNKRHSRFCIECGCRPSSGPNWYSLGNRWIDNDVPFVRCIICHKCAKAPQDKAIRECERCWTSERERKRAAEELGRTTQEREERRRLRAERRQRDIVVFGSPQTSDGSSEGEIGPDVSWHWGLKNWLNHSAQS